MSLKSDQVKETSGLLTGLSHVIILKKQPLFIFNIASETEIFSVVVRKQSQLSWQASLKVGAIYTCYNLRRTKLYQGTEDETDVLVATSQTQIVEGRARDVVHFAEDGELARLISYEGTVTAADPSLQLYELDSSCQLVLSSIAVVTSCPQLRCGDHVVVHDGHWEPAEKRLYACGRTHVQLLNRPPEPVVSSKQAAVHTLHRLTMPPSAVIWYRQMAGLISAAAAGRVPTDGEKGVLHRLLLLEKLPITERSLAKEFVCRPHRCIASQKFRAPFQLCPLSNLVSAVVTDSAPPDPSDTRGWHHWIGTDPGRRTVALLTRGPAGGLQLESAEGGGCRVPLLLLPPAAGATAARPSIKPPVAERFTAEAPPAGTPAVEAVAVERLVNCLVCVAEPRLVVERLGAGEPQVYLLCTEGQVTPLQDRAEEMETIPAPALDSTPRPVRLLLHQRSSPRRAAAAGAGGGAGGGDGAGVCVVLHGLLEEAGRRRPVLVRLAGAAAVRAGRLRREATYLLQSADQHWTAREQSCGQLQKQLRPWLVDCAVIRGPDDLRFIADGSPPSQQLASDVLSVSELTPGGPDDGLLTVRGVILERRHARDRFAKTSHQQTISLDTHRVVLRLCDPASPDEVPLYVCEPAQWVSLLGLVPGAALTAHAVRWAGGGGAGAGGQAAAGTHLVTTPLSELQLTGWSPPPEHTGARRPRLHLPVQFLCAALSDPAVTRWVSCVTVADLRRVSLSAECGLCGHQLAAGCCTFVGCHGNGRHLFNARARAVIDDGSAAVTAQLIGDSVRQLLAVTEAEWGALTEEAEQKGEIYHLQSRTKQGGHAPGTAGLLSTVCQSVAVKRPIVCELKKFADRPASAPAAGSGAVQTVFCEAVMEASAAVVTRLYPAPAPAAPRDVTMTG